MLFKIIIFEASKFICAIYTEDNKATETEKFQLINFQIVVKYILSSDRGLTKKNFKTYSILGLIKIPLLRI